MKRIFTIAFLVLGVTMMVSCNSRTAKEGGKVVKNLYKEYRAMTHSDAYRYYQNQRRLNTFYNLMQNMSKCSTCSGYGVVYMVDDYGNYIGQYDMYGNFYPNVYVCPECGGTGQ